MAEVWYADLTLCGAVLDALEAIEPRLSPDEAAWPGHRHPGHQHEESSSGADPTRRRVRIALRLLIERALPPAAIAVARRAPLSVSASGRPELAPHVREACAAAPVFSITHTEGLALIAIAPAGPLGVDLETPRDVRMAPWRLAVICEAARLITEAPLPADPDAATVQGWTRLEALAKASGLGIAHLLGAIGVMGPAAPDRTPAAARAMAAACGVHVRDLALEAVAGHRVLYASIAAPAGEEVVLYRLPCTLRELTELPARRLPA
jgi:phosphopantetheinyl transferase